MVQGLGREPYVVWMEEILVYCIPEEAHSSRFVGVIHGRIGAYLRERERERERERGGERQRERERGIYIYICLYTHMNRYLYIFLYTHTL